MARRTLLPAVLAAVAVAAMLAGFAPAALARSGETTPLTAASAASPARASSGHVPSAGGTATPRKSKSSLGSRTVLVLAGFVVVAVCCFASTTARARRLKAGNISGSGRDDR